MKKTIQKNALDKFLDKKLGNLETSKEFENISKDDLLISHDFNSLYRSAQIDIKCTWPKIEIAYPLKNLMSDAFNGLFNSRRWKDSNGYAFLSVKYHNPDKLGFQHLPVKEKINNPYRNIRLEEIIKMRNGITIDTLTSIDIVEIVKCGGIILEVFDGFFCQNLDFNPYTAFATVMFEKRDLFKA